MRHSSQNDIANKAMHKLVAHNQSMLAIGLRRGTVAGVPIITTKEEFSSVDTVTLYLNPRRQQEYYEYIIRLDPRRVIFNPGTENPKFYTQLEAAGIQVEIACTLVLLATNQYETQKSE